MGNPTPYNFLWGNIGAGVSLFTGAQLNALASGSGSAYGAEQGGANQPELGFLWLHLDTNSIAFTSTSYVSIYLVSSTTPNTASGTYPTYTSGASYKLAGSNYQLPPIYINPATQSSNVVDETLPNIILPPGFWKPVLVNNTGTAFPATANNTLTLYTTPTQY